MSNELIDSFTSENSILAYLNIDKFEYPLIDYSEKQKKLDRFDMYILLSLFSNARYSFDAMLRFLLANLDIESISQIAEKREVFNNKDELKESNDTLLKNYYSLLLRHIDNIELPNDFPVNKYKERLQKRLSIENSDIDTKIPKDIPLFSQFLLSDDNKGNR